MCWLNTLRGSHLFEEWGKYFLSSTPPHFCINAAPKARRAHTARDSPTLHSNIYAIKRRRIFQSFKLCLEKLNKVSCVQFLILFLPTSISESYFKCICSFCFSSYTLLQTYPVLKFPNQRAHLIPNT